MCQESLLLYISFDTLCFDSTLDSVGHLSLSRYCTEYKNLNTVAEYVCIMSEQYCNHRVDRVLSSFSSRRNWDSPTPSLACGRGGWGSPNSDEGTYTVDGNIYSYMCFVSVTIAMSLRPVGHVYWALGSEAGVHACSTDLPFSRLKVRMVNWSCNIAVSYALKIFILFVHYSILYTYTL
jgi:hypothetical protein